MFVQYPKCLCVCVGWDSVCLSTVWAAKKLCWRTSVCLTWLKKSTSWSMDSSHPSLLNQSVQTKICIKIHIQLNLGQNRSTSGHHIRVVIFCHIMCFMSTNLKTKKHQILLGSTVFNAWCILFLCAIELHCCIYKGGFSLLSSS